MIIAFSRNEETGPVGYYLGSHNELVAEFLLFQEDMIPCGMLSMWECGTETVLQVLIIHL